MKFKNVLFVGVSLGALVTLSAPLQAMNREADSDDGSRTSQHSQAFQPMGIIAAERGEDVVSFSDASSETPSHGPQVAGSSSSHGSQDDPIYSTVVTKEEMLQPERTPVLKQKLFAPWKPEWSRLEWAAARQLARDSLKRLVDNNNPIHRSMYRKAWHLLKELDAPRLLDCRAEVNRETRRELEVAVQRLVWTPGEDQALKFAKRFQKAWNKKVLKSEAVAAHRIARENELKAELLAVAQEEMQNLALFPRISAEEREGCLVVLERMASNVELRVLMGQFLLKRGQVHMADTLRHPVLGPRLLDEIRRVASPVSWNVLTEFSYLLEELHPELLQDQVVPEGALEVSEETQAVAHRLLAHAETAAEVRALRNSIYGPALMSLEALEMTIENATGERIRHLVGLFPNLKRLTWSWGPNVRITERVLERGILPFLRGIPQTLTHLLRRNEVDPAVSQPLEEALAEWAPGLERAGAAPVLETEVAYAEHLEADRALLRQFERDEILRLFRDPRRAAFQFDSSQGEDRSLSYFSLMAFLMNFDGMRFQGSQVFYAALQNLRHQVAEEALGTVDLESLRPILEAGAHAVFQDMNNVSFYPWHQPEDGTPYPQSYMTPPLQGPAPAVDTVVRDFSYLSPRLQELLQQVSDEGLPLPAPESFMIGGPEKNLLEPFGLYRTAERR